MAARTFFVVAGPLTRMAPESHSRSQPGHPQKGRCSRPGRPEAVVARLAMVSARNKGDTTMAQGDKPSFTVSFINGDDDKAKWHPIGAVFKTKHDKLHTGEIIIPMAAMMTGSIRIAVREWEPKDEQ
jgi:hypothetical protein